MDYRQKRIKIETKSVSFLNTWPFWLALIMILLTVYQFNNVVQSAMEVAAV